MSGGEHNGHLPVGWDGPRPLDCVKCGEPWPCDEATDQVYGKLMSAREALCVAQMYVRPHWRNDVQEALDLIDEVGSGVRSEAVVPVQSADRGRKAARMTVKKRYPLQALADILGADLPSLSRTLGISGSTWKEYRDLGVSEKVADRLASKVGRHPGEVWPEYLDDQIAELEQAEAEKKQRRRAQQAASARRRYAEDPEVRERVKARSRDYRRSIDDGRRQRDPKVKASKLAHLRRVRSTPEGRAAYNAYMREWKRRKREAA